MSRDSADCSDLEQSEVLHDSEGDDERPLSRRFDSPFQLEEITLSTHNLVAIDVTRGTKAHNGNGHAGNGGGQGVKELCAYIFVQGVTKLPHACESCEGYKLGCTAYHPVLQSQQSL